MRKVLVFFSGRFQDCIFSNFAALPFSRTTAVWLYSTYIQYVQYSEAIFVIVSQKNNCSREVFTPLISFHLRYFFAENWAKERGGGAKRASLKIGLRIRLLSTIKFFYVRATHIFLLPKNGKYEAADRQIIRATEKRPREIRVGVRCRSKKKTASAEFTRFSQVDGRGRDGHLGQETGGFGCKEKKKNKWDYVTTHIMVYFALEGRGCVGGVGGQSQESDPPLPLSVLRWDAFAQLVVVPLLVRAFVKSKVVSLLSPLSSLSLSLCKRSWNFLTHESFQ